jgi:hypothetical protein
MRCVPGTTFFQVKVTGTLTMYDKSPTHWTANQIRRRSDTSVSFKLHSGATNTVGIPSVATCDVLF